MTALAIPFDHKTTRPPLPILRIVALAALCLFFSLAAGNRWLGWGKDYEQYLLAYNTISPTFLFGNTRFELGYELTGWVFAVVLGLPFAAFYVFLCIIALVIKFYLFERYLSNPLLAAVVYLLLFFPTHEYTQIRAAVAISFGFAAIHCVIERKWLFAAGLSALSVLFHSSAMVLVLLGTIAVLIPRRVGIVAIPSAAVALIIISSAASNALSSTFVTFNPLFYSYLDNVDASQAINIFSVSNLLMAASVVLMFAFRFYARDDYIFPFLLLPVFGFVLLVVFRGSPVLALRTSEIMMLSVIFAGIRLPLSEQTLIIRGLLLLNGAWLIYRAITEGTLG